MKFSCLRNKHSVKLIVLAVTDRGVDVKNEISPKWSIGFNSCMNVIEDVSIRITFPLFIK